MTQLPAIAEPRGPESPGCPAAPQAAVPKVNVLGVGVSSLTMEETLARIAAILRRGEKGYVCSVNVYGVVAAQRDAGLAAAYADATLAIPDGMPIAWVGRFQGRRAMERVAGPELMRAVLLRPELAGYSHFFYGGRAGVAEKLADNFSRLAPHANIVGTWTPPFRELTRAEERKMIATVNRLRPDMIWVGLGSPKQDKFMRRYAAKFDTGLMLGVGAAFDFHTGGLRDCAPWVKRAGLQWLHRLMQEPRRLAGRYLRSNPAFLFLIALQLSGLRTYALPAEEAERFVPPGSRAGEDCIS